MLYIRTFGGCSVERDGVRLDELAGQRKPLAFLALLAGAGARGVTRERAASLLWPEGDDERSRTSLKQLVHSLRTRLGVPELLVPGVDLRLDAHHATSDVAEFREAVRQGDVERAVSVYAGPFLAGVHIRRADGFERWASEERTSLAREFARALEQVAEKAASMGDKRGAVEAWLRLVNAEPLDARVVISGMRALEAAGDPSAAIQQGRAFQARIREALDIESDPSVADVLDQLLQRMPNARSSPAASSANARQPATTTTAPSAPTLAVLPFVNTGGDDSDEHFSDGLTDELIGTIGKTADVTVTGRTSSFAFKGKAVDVRTVAESLQVGAVLEGSVRRGGDRLKVGAQLIRASDGAVIWSEIYDRDARDLFAIQEEIARAIANALRIRLAPIAPSTRRTTADLVAYELYLKGRYFQNRVTIDDLRRSAQYFEQAVARDPDYAKAYAGIADAHLLLAVLGDGEQDHHVACAREAVTRALALDSTLAEAHTSLASLSFSFDWAWTAALRGFERAIAVDPAYGLAHPRYGLCLMYQGRVSEAQPVFERARAVDPLAPSSSMNLGRLHLSTGRADSAIPLLKAALELNPNLGLAHEHLGYAHLKLGQEVEALSAFRAVSTFGGARGSTRLAYALAVTGQETDARAIVDSLSSAARPPAFGLAIAHVGLGQRDAAMEWLERAYTERDPFMHTVKATVPFETLRSHSRWAKLLRRMGLAP